MIVRPIARALATAPDSAPLSGLPWDAAGAATGWSPASLGPDLTLWLDSGGVYDDAGEVSHWFDTRDLDGGTGRYLLASGFGTTPAVSTVAGRVAPSYDGATDALGIEYGVALSSLITSTEWSVRVIWQYAATATAPAAGLDEDPILMDGIGWFPVTLSTSGVKCSASDGTVRATSRVAVSANTVTRTRCQLSGGSLSMRTASTTATPAACGAMANLSTTLRTGHNGLSGPYLNGRIGDIVIVRRALTAKETSLLDAYDAARYPGLVV